MNDILQLKILNNTVQLYIEVFGFILIALIIKRIISKYLAALLFRLFTKKEKQFRKNAFIELIVSPLDAFLITFIIVITLDRLAMPPILQFNIYKVTTKDLLDGIASIAMIVTFIRLCIRFVKYISLIFEEKANLTADQSDNQLVIFFRDFLKVLLYIIGIMLLLRFTFNYDISKLVTGLSIVGCSNSTCHKGKS
jgi:MscS family membrane protein